MTNRPERYTELDAATAEAVADWLRGVMDARNITTQTQLVDLTRERGRHVSEATIRPLMNGVPRGYRTDKLRDLCWSVGLPLDTIERIANGQAPASAPVLDLEVEERFDAIEARLKAIEDALQKRSRRPR